MKFKIPILAGASVFLIFIFLSYLVTLGLTTSFDFNATVSLQSNLSGILPERRVFDVFLSTLSLFGSFEIMSIVLLLILFKIKNLKPFPILLFYIIFHIVEILGKTFINQISPPLMFFRYNIPFLFPTSDVDLGFSYPSGHAGRTTFISVILLFLILRSRRFSNVQKTALTILVVLFDIGVLISRVYLGEHWASDVIGGTLLGASLSILTINLLDRGKS